MALRRPKSIAWPEEEHVRLRSALARLDPWSFWAVRLDRPPGADYAVVGSTGAFVISICGLDGYVESVGAGLRVGEVSISGFREVKRAAKVVRGRLSHVSVSTEVRPLICLTRAIAGTSRDVRGVRVVRLDDLPSEIASRERTLDPGTAKKAAAVLGPLVVSAPEVHRDDAGGSA